MPASPALELGIKTLGEAIQLTPASPALAVISTSRNILQMITANSGAYQDEKCLALKVQDIAIEYYDGVEKLDKQALNDTEIRHISENLLDCLSSISQEIQNKPKAGFFARLLTQSSTRQRIKSWDADLEHISTRFAVNIEYALPFGGLPSLQSQVQLQCVKMSQAVLLQGDNNLTEGIQTLDERIREANQAALDLIKSEVLKHTRKKLHKSSFGHFPQAASPIFYGRSQQVEHLVESLVNVPAYHAILGPGGMGKTSTGLNVLHDPRIIHVYGKHRYFLACETTLDANGIIAGLADIFSLNERAFVKLFKELCKVIDANILFLLDNFETPWERKEARQKVEDLLTDLSSIPNLSIVITLRGAERASGIPWSRPFLPILGTLDLGAARQTFLAISDVGDSDEAMDTLLAEVDFIPLAITLLAAQAPYTTCACLLEQWKSSKTSMITRGWDSRLSSLDVSISLSLTSSRFTSIPRALFLLQVLSMLPDGATVDELRDMTAGDIDIHKALSTLIQTSLADIGLHDRLRVLSPILEHVQSRHSISHTLLQHVLSYHAQLCRYAMSEAFTTEATIVDDMLRACIGNILHVIRFCLDVEPLTNEAIEAALNLARFRRNAYSGSISQLLEKSTKIARARQQFIPLAQGLHEISVRIMGNIGSSGDWPIAFRYLEEAIDILGRQSSPERRDLLIDTLLSQSWMMIILNRNTEAVKIAQEAVSLISPSTSPAISALAYLRLGECLVSTREYSESLKALEQAGRHFQSRSSPVLGFRVSISLSRLYFSRDMYRQSINVADMGLSRHNRSDSARAFLLIQQAQVRILLCCYEDARRDLCEAIKCMAESYQPLN